MIRSKSPRARQKAWFQDSLPNGDAFFEFLPFMPEIRE